MKYLSLIIATLMASLLYAVRPAGGDEDFDPSVPEATHYPAMILVSDDENISDAIEELEASGVTILRHRGNILLAFIPVESHSEVRKLRGIKDVRRSKPRFSRPTMNHARLFNDAYLINEGYQLAGPFDGRGVVVGVCDIGIDTRHPNFLNSTLDECRIRLAVQYEELQGKRTAYATPTEIYEWQTDNDDEWHATHVTGIAAGAFREGGYQSLAPEADIVFTASQLSDVGLLAGVEDIIEYAKSVGKPAVINLSMGNYTGPHDGTALFSQYLDMCAEDAIICLSAGNEGNTTEPKAMRFDFSDSAAEVRVRATDWDGLEVSGIAEVWSLDDTPFDFTFYLGNGDSYAKRIDAWDAVTSRDGSLAEWRISADPSDPDYDEALATYYTQGYVSVTAGLSTLNGRYYAEMEFDLITDRNSEGHSWAEYWTGMKVNAEPGTHVDIFCGSGSFLRGERTFPEPDNELCFSDLASGHKVISVGMMNNTDVWDNMAAGSGYAKGDVCIYSSYGTLPDGRKMPMTVAPGAYVISSISSPYLEKYPEDIQNTDYNTQFDGKTVYWIGNIGTSMSCPFVAGAIATWLQAYPSLSSEEAIRIVQATNQTSGYPDPGNPRHGQGWFSAYKGMQQILELAALQVDYMDVAAPAMRFDGLTLHVGNPAPGSARLDVYDVSGRVVTSRRLNEPVAQLSLAGLPAGLYVATLVPASGKSVSLKIKR